MTVTKTMYLRCKTCGKLTVIYDYDHLQTTVEETCPICGADNGLWYQPCGCGSSGSQVLACQEHDPQIAEVVSRWHARDQALALLRAWLASPTDTRLRAATVAFIANAEGPIAERNDHAT